MKKKLRGTVVSAAMEKTVVVEVVSRSPHPLYKKVMKRTKRYKVDTNGKTPAVGEQVRIIETRPLAKDKYFKIDALVGKKEAEK